MHIEYHKWWSYNLCREMEYKIFGHDGQAVLAFPCQDGRFYDWENYGMIGVLAPMIDAGRIRIICVDGIDWETWSNRGADKRWRIEQHERWFHYVVDELLPNLRFNNWQQFITTGCSMGGFHAANFFFRRPDVFDAVISMSGLYDSDYGFPNYHDELTYANSPISFIGGMPADHPWIDQYRQRQIIICVGQGRWEDELLESTRRLDAVVRSKNIPAWIDYWGHDVDHDWPWWRAQLAYFMDKVLG